MSTTIIARFAPNPGAEARVETILRTMVGATRSEPGCLRYDLYRAGGASPGAATIFCLIEQYVDAAAIQAHRDTAHYKDYRARIAPLLAQQIDVLLLEAIDAREGR